jgi:hypothetical protein
MNRGRPKETPTPKREKWTMEFFDVPTKPELGGRSVWHYDLNKNPDGVWKVENFLPRGEKLPVIKPQKGKPYAKQPVVMVFKTSNRSNAKTKMKVWNNENVDYILSADKLPGVPSNAIILEVAVGKSFIESYKLKYTL